MSMFKFLNCSIDLTFSKLTSNWFVDDLKFYQLFYKFFIQNLLEHFPLIISILINQYIVLFFLFILYVYI